MEKLYVFYKLNQLNQGDEKYATYNDSTRTTR